MNWVKSKVRDRDTKKKQKEFFQRQRNAVEKTGVSVKRRGSQQKSTSVTQDLIALRAKRPLPPSEESVRTHRNISHIDLDQFSSCRKVSHMDLGPMSPVNRPVQPADSNACESSVLQGLSCRRVPVLTAGSRLPPTASTLDDDFFPPLLSRANRPPTQPYTRAAQSSRLPRPAVTRPETVRSSQFAPPSVVEEEDSFNLATILNQQPQSKVTFGCTQLRDCSSGGGSSTSGSTSSRHQEVPSTRKSAEPRHTGISSEVEDFQESFFSRDHSKKSKTGIGPDMFGELNRPMTVQHSKVEDESPFARSASKRSQSFASLEHSLTESDADERHFWPKVPSPQHLYSTVRTDEEDMESPLRCANKFACSTSPCLRRYDPAQWPCKETPVARHDPGKWPSLDRFRCSANLEPANELRSYSTRSASIGLSVMKEDTLLSCSQSPLHHHSAANVNPHIVSSGARMGSLEMTSQRAIECEGKAASTVRSNKWWAFVNGSKTKALMPGEDVENASTAVSSPVLSLSYANTTFATQVSAIETVVLSDDEVCGDDEDPLASCQSVGRTHRYSDYRDLLMHKTAALVEDAPPKKFCAHVTEQKLKNNARDSAKPNGEGKRVEETTEDCRVCRSEDSTEAELVSRQSVASAHSETGASSVMSGLVSNPTSEVSVARNSLTSYHMESAVVKETVNTNLVDSSSDKKLKSSDEESRKADKASGIWRLEHGSVDGTSAAAAGECAGTDVADDVSGRLIHCLKSTPGQPSDSCENLRGLCGEVDEVPCVPGTENDAVESCAADVDGTGSTKLTENQCYDQCAPPLVDESSPKRLPSSGSADELKTKSENSCEMRIMLEPGAVSGVCSGELDASTSSPVGVECHATLPQESVIQTTGCFSAKHRELAVKLNSAETQSFQSSVVADDAANLPVLTETAGSTETSVAMAAQVPLHITWQLDTVECSMQTSPFMVDVGCSPLCAVMTRCVGCSPLVHIQTRSAATSTDLHSILQSCSVQTDVCLVDGHTFPTGCLQSETLTSPAHHSETPTGPLHRSETPTGPAHHSETPTGPLHRSETSAGPLHSGMSHTADAQSMHSTASVDKSAIMTTGCCISPGLLPEHIETFCHKLSDAVSTIESESNYATPPDGVFSVSEMARKAGDGKQSPQTLTQPCSSVKLFDDESQELHKLSSYAHPQSAWISQRTPASQVESAGNEASRADSYHPAAHDYRCDYPHSLQSSQVLPNCCDDSSGDIETDHTNSEDEPDFQPLFE